MVKSLVKSLLFNTGYYNRRLRDDHFPGVAVLCYHGILRSRNGFGRLPFADLHVRLETFRQHCAVIRQLCHPISLEQWRSAVSGGPPLPARPVLLTFDDGYHTVATEALPVLQSAAIPAVFFICSGPVQRRETLWYDTLAREHGDQAVYPWRTRSYRDWAAERPRWQKKAGAEDPMLPMTIEQVRQIASTPGMEIGGHTVNHPYLISATPEEQRQEIEENRKTLEEWTGRSIRAFAFPSGGRGVDYNEHSIEVVRTAGYGSAFNTESSFAERRDLGFEIPRFVMLEGISAPELSHRLAVSWRP